MSEPLASPGPPIDDLGFDIDGGGELDVICPRCGEDLGTSEIFATFRVCPTCGRHFALPAQERLELLLDPGSFVETNSILVSADPLRFQDDLPTPERPVELLPRREGEITGGVVTGSGTIDGHAAVLIVLDLASLGGSIGVVAGEKITLGLERAYASRFPVVVICSSGRGPSRTQEGLLALAQSAKIASTASLLKRAGLPVIALLTDPSTGAVFTGLANQADVIFAEPGAQVGVDLPTIQPGAPVGSTGLLRAEEAEAGGQIDGVIERPRLREVLGGLLGIIEDRGHRGAAVSARVHVIPPAVVGVATAAESIALARHPGRPNARMYLQQLIPDLIELHGDRVSNDDANTLCGLGRLDGLAIAIIAQDRGEGTEAGYRKASRLLRLAGHLELPVVILIDSPGIAAGGAAAGLGAVVGQTLSLMAMLPVPIVTVAIGEAGGAAALALAVGDRMLMLEHAICTVAGRGGALPNARGPERAESPGMQAMTARECLRFGLIDQVVAEPETGAHSDPGAAAQFLRDALLQALSDVAGFGSRRLLDERARRVRHFGQTTPEGRAATRREVLDLEELQRNLARSIGEWRERWEHRARLNPRRQLASLHLRRPDLSGRLAALRGHVGSTDVEESGPRPERQD